MRKKKRCSLWTGFLLLVMVVSSLILVQEEAFAQEDTVVYDASSMTTFKNRTIQDVADRYAAAKNCSDVYSDSDSSTWYKIPASLEAPYAYGELSSETHKAMTEMTNFYRWLAGAEPLKTYSTHSDSLQAQALDRNFEFNHYISNSSKPEDMDASLWAEGFECTHNILARYYTPCGAITGWMNEGYRLSTQQFDTIGHRMALIGSTLSQINFGYSGYIAIGDDTSYGNSRKEAFTAFPAPGYMPNHLISPGISAWSVELNPSTITIENSSDVMIKVTNKNTGKSYVCSKAIGNASISSVIAFAQPADAGSGYYTDSCEVSITGLKDVLTGKGAAIKYTVQFVDIKPYAATYVKEVAPDIKNYVIYQSAAENDFLKKVAAILPQKITVKGESGYTASVPVKGSWKVNTTQNCFENSVDPASLPENMVDKKGLLNAISIPYVISDSWYDAYNSLYIKPSEAKEGDLVTFYVYRTLISTDSSSIYKIGKNSDGTYRTLSLMDSSGSQWFSSADSEQSDSYHIYKKNAALGDSGEYISVYYDSDDVNWSGISYYVSVGTQKLSVQKKSIGSSTNTSTGSTTGTTSVTTKSIRISFQPNKGTVSKKTKTIKAGSKIGTLPTPKRKGYTFTGWYTQKTKGKKVSGNTKLSKNTVLYAHWLKGTVPKTGISKLTAGKQKITVGIKKVKNVKGYQVRYAPKSNMQSAKSVSSKNTTITLKKLKKGKKYYIQVRTYRLDTSGDKVYGSWSSKKSIKSK